MAANHLGHFLLAWSLACRSRWQLVELAPVEGCALSVGWTAKTSCSKIKMIAHAKHPAFSTCAVGTRMLGAVQDVCRGDIMVAYPAEVR